METKPQTQKPTVSTAFNLGQLPDGTYTIARCVADTDAGKFAKDGKAILKFTTVFMVGATVAQFTQFGKSEQEPDITERGDPVIKFKAGSRVLMRHEHRTYEKELKKNTIVELNGKVLDVQAA
jgi:hypothetical protein